MQRLFGQRPLIYLCTFLTGMTGLIFQVTWQKYLATLVGSEARSISMVVAVFLAGLALGYRYWGKLSESDFDRRGLVRLYGFIELAIGIYAMLFPIYEVALRALAWRLPVAGTFVSPLADLVITALALLLPTFLMGATIPLLTKAVPETLREVPGCHARIYGINTLGAFLGTLVGSFILLPRLGLPFTMILGGCINGIIGILLVFNRLQAPASATPETATPPNPFGNRTICAYVALTGAVVVCLEVLIVRVASLTLGSLYFVYPIVLAVFIVGLALGSLTLPADGGSQRYLQRQLAWLIAALALIYLSIPYWPYWMSNVRVSLVSLPNNYPVFITLALLGAAVILLPALIPLGRLLPLGYALLDKRRDDYGAQCGRLYAWNAFGTVAGAVGLGYLALYWLNVDAILKLNLTLLTLLAAHLLWKTNRQELAVVTVAIAIVAALLPAWDRSSLSVGLFRIRQAESYNFTGLLQKPRMIEEINYFKDDPNSSVSVATLAQSRSIFVNGKSDSNTRGDYSTTVLLGSLPYLFARDGSNLQTTVIGLGTGMTAGVLSTARDVETVTVLEVSPAVIDANRFFTPYNFNLKDSGKLRLVQTDAFKHLARQRQKIDLLVSEPSNPWVAGVENLYTPELFKLASEKLADDGVFIQWMHVYDMNESILYSVVANMQQAFQHTQLFILNASDIGIIASNSPLQQGAATRRLAEPALAMIHQPMHFTDPDQIELLKIYDHNQLQWLVDHGTPLPHSLDFPKLYSAASRAMFMNLNIRISELSDPLVARHLRYSAARSAAFDRLVAKSAGKPQNCNALDSGTNLFCMRLSRLEESLRQTKRPQDDEAAAISAYQQLRNEGYVAADLTLLRTIAASLRDKKRHKAPLHANVAENLIREFSYEKAWDEARDLLNSFVSDGTVSSQQGTRLIQEMQTAKSKQQLLLSRTHKGDA